ncbi:MAG: QueT transporter family protein [Eubacterium sp.]|nr:QueT transporter family protein [Eubacterium sp.]
MKNKKILFVTQAAMIAAVYVVITIALAPISFGEVQVRVSEALTIMPMFTAAAVPGVFIGCLIANVLGGAVLPDIIFGSLATLIAAAFTYKLRAKSLWVGSIPPIVANMIVVPFVLKYAYSVPLPIPFMMLTVGIGELVSCSILGVGLGKLLQKNRFILGDNINESNSSGVK